MSLFLLPHQELENNDDYARWQFETAKAEWEAEQPEPCTHPVTGLSSHLAYHGYIKRLVRLASCGVCGDVLGIEID